MNFTYNKKFMGKLFLIPALFFIAIFMVYPFISAIIYSFTNRTFVVNPNGIDLVGLQNYIDVLTDPNFWQAFLVNIKFTVVVVPIQLSLAFGLAILINNKVKGIGFFRTVYFSPVVIPMIVVSITWSLLLAPGEDGFVNVVLDFLSRGKLGPFEWLYSADTALISIMILSIWQGVGFQTILFLAGLQSIPEEVYEASKIDGAGFFRTLFHITIPQMKYTISFVLTSGIIGSFKLITQVLVLTDGGPQGSTTTLVYLIYKSGFIDQRIGYSAAVSVIFFSLVLIITLISNKIQARAGDL